ncbi:hypothetical protein FJU08_00070 [Martelella alba]|uniref:Uncharacterized protein n=1 Tax=Martelella alba TaxID=2590451 RepID=A0A506UI68_9HYPH|nr:hypothetical protein [Martelella alba]TPW33002.1 hypothetical protein FJU08_00070 [Martelella alba]
MKLKLALAAALLVATTAPASAINRYDVNTMTCAQAQAVVAQEGAAILRYPAPDGSGRILYDRYVKSPGVCFVQAGHAVKNYIPTKDTKSCLVLSCESGPPDCSDDPLALFCDR